MCVCRGGDLREVGGCRVATGTDGARGSPLSRRVHFNTGLLRSPSDTEMCIVWKTTNDVDHIDTDVAAWGVLVRSHRLQTTRCFG